MGILMRHNGFRRLMLAWSTLAVIGLLVGLAGPAVADDAQWDPTLPKVPSAGAPGDPVAIANASIAATAQATQTTLDLGRKFWAASASVAEALAGVAAITPARAEFRGCTVVRPSST